MLRFIVDSYKYCNDMNKNRYGFFLFATFINALWAMAIVYSFITLTFEFHWVAVRLALVALPFQIAPMVVYYIHLRR